ncbi:hypothetical protein [Pseudomonas putida]|uniref:Ig-like domain-containing protein n=1 Tax=Pseudomonas putida S13.1.2 TaxID=1384061 RepID=A0AAU8RYE0_PSEPU|nr:hypothetical protein [Pseudomonas putida]AJQ47877.1 hypothetical protein N805_11900 [Pseudomonas putida S13.1.2]
MDHSTAELVSWLAEKTRLLGWDMVIFIDGSKINAMLRQESFRRFGTASDMPSISGYISNGADYRFALSRCNLSLPRLVFDVALAGHKAHMPMVIAEANAYSLMNKGNQWYVRQLDVMGPLQEASLSLDINLEESGGRVDEDDTIKLDLSKTENFSMPCYTGETRLLTEFFRQKFSALTDEQRQFPIGQLAKRNVELHQPVSYGLRTQARGRTPTDVEGAVVLLVDMKDGAGGAYPGADYKYAIPNDGHYSATILFDTERLLLAQLVSALGSVITGAEFEWRRRGDEPPSVSCKAGYMSLPRQRREEKAYIRAFDNDLWIVKGQFEFDEARIDMRDALSVSKVGDQWKISLSLRGSLTVRCDDLNDHRGITREALVRDGYSMADFHKPVQAGFQYDAEFVYSFERQYKIQLVSQSYEFNERMAFQPVFGAIRPPRASDTMIPADDLIALVLNPAIANLTTKLGATLSSRLPMNFTSLQDVLVSNLRKNVVLLPGASKIARDVLRFNFHRTLIATKLAVPLDTAYFGKVNPAANYFTISPMETFLLADDTITFMTEPAFGVGLVLWSVKAVSGLAEGVRLSMEKGVFTAPPASDMTKSYAQVLVTATSTIFPTIQSRALITVVRETLQANPSVVVAQPGSKVNFNAWALGDPAALEWQYQNKAVGKGQTVTVTCPADPGTVAFVVEEVQVKDPESQHTSTCVLITEMAKKMPMAVSANVDPAGAKAVLEARVNGNVVAPDKINWDVLYGPGEAPAGVYTPGIGDTACFALISAAYDSGDFGIFEGYALLALPLAEHRDITKVQSD